MKKEKKDKKPLILGIILIVLVLGILLFVYFTHEDISLKARCRKAVCNENYTICYDYYLDKEGNTIITWRGNCSVLK